MIQTSGAAEPDFIEVEASGQRRRLQGMLTDNQDGRYRFLQIAPPEALDASHSIHVIDDIERRLPAEYIVGGPNTPHVVLWRPASEETAG